jgi:hypothetical protein
MAKSPAFNQNTIGIRKKRSGPKRLATISTSSATGRMPWLPISPFACTAKEAKADR